jgi:hypothetical protein
MNTEALKDRELSDAELEAVTGGEDKLLAPVIKAAVMKAIDLDCYLNNPRICPIPIQL